LLDTIYHEHLSYFTVHPLVRLFRSRALEVIDIRHLDAKGGSIRVMVQRLGARRQVSKAVDEYLAREIAFGYGDLATYRALGVRYSEIRLRLHELVADAKKKHFQVAGYGVSVGTSALIAQFDLSRELDMLFDDSSEKDPLLSGPNYDLPVFSGDAVGFHNPGLIIIFAWRYAEWIVQKHRAFRDHGGRFVVPLPAVSLL
jgi:hypothetical protein